MSTNPELPPGIIICGGTPTPRDRAVLGDFLAFLNGGSACIICLTPTDECTTGGTRCCPQCAHAHLDTDPAAPGWRAVRDPIERATHDCDLPDGHHTLECWTTVWTWSANGWRPDAVSVAANRVGPEPDATHARNTGTVTDQEDQ